MREWDPIDAPSETAAHEKRRMRACRLAPATDGSAHPRRAPRAEGTGRGGPAPNRTTNTLHVQEFRLPNVPPARWPAAGRFTGQRGTGKSPAPCSRTAGARAAGGALANQPARAPTPQPCGDAATCAAAAAAGIRLRWACDGRAMVGLRVGGRKHLVGGAALALQFQVVRQELRQMRPGQGHAGVRAAG